MSIELETALRSIHAEDLRAEVEATAPQLASNRKLRHCAGCGHAIRKGSLRVVKPYLNAHDRICQHSYHFEAVCLGRHDIDISEVR